VTARLSITEPARQTPLHAETDVLVVGGGAAGAAAAIAAARSGADTMLVRTPCGEARKVFKHLP